MTMMTLNDLQKKWNETSPFSGGFLQVSEDHPLSVHVGYENDLRCFVILDTGRIDNIDSSKAIDAVCIELSAKKFGLKFLLPTALMLIIINMSLKSAYLLIQIPECYKSLLSSLHILNQAI